MELTTQLVGLDKVIGDLNAMIERADDLSQPLGRLGNYHVKKADRILASGDRGIKTRNRPGLGTSITFAMGLNRNSLVVGSNKPYAASQQFGPSGGFYESSRPGGYLAIPIADNILSRGNARFKSPRDVEGGFFFKSKNGTLLFGKRSDRKRSSNRKRARAGNIPGIELLFVLKERVPGQAHMYVTHDTEDQVYWDRLVGRWILKGTI